MADSHSTTRNKPLDLIDAIDILSEARSLSEFVQSIAINAPSNESVTLSAQQLSGFGYAMQDVIDRVKEAEEIVDGLRGVQRVDNSRVGGAMAGMDALRNIEGVVARTRRMAGDAGLSMDEWWQIQDGAVEAMLISAGKQDSFMTGFLTTLTEYIIAVQESGTPDLEKWNPEAVMTPAEKMAHRTKFDEEVEPMATHTA
jgi:hypothetical protein